MTYFYIVAGVCLVVAAWLVCGVFEEWLFDPGAKRRMKVDGGDRD